MARVGLALVMMLSLVACATNSAVPQVADPDVARARLVDPEATRDSLVHGRSLYLSHCTGCHAPFSPTELSLSEWEHELADMRERAGVDPEEERLILAYLGTFSAPSEAR